MPLQPEALRKVRETAREQLVAFMAGYFSTGINGIVPTITADQFVVWYRREYPHLADHVDSELVTGWITVEMENDSYRNAQQNKETGTGSKGDSGGVSQGESRAQSYGILASRVDAGGTSQNFVPPRESR